MKIGAMLRNKGEFMSMKKYFLVTDLDGTLLNSNHEISEYNYKQIKQFQQKNGLFKFATGRMNDSVYRFIKELNITIPVITYNGAQVFCPLENKVIYEKSFVLSKEMYNQLAEVSFAEIIFYYDDQAFTLKKDDLIKEFEQKEKVTCKVMASEKIPEKVTKIMLLSEDRRKLEELEIDFKARFESVSFIFSESNYLEILPKNVSKGEALKEVKRLYELKDIYTVGFGNNLNDISLLEAANQGIAVKNSVTGLLDVADQVSPYTNNEHAVGHYIESLLVNSG